MLVLLLFFDTLKSTLPPSYTPSYIGAMWYLLFTFFGLRYQIHAKLLKKMRLSDYKFCPLEPEQIIVNSLVLFGISYVCGKAISKHKFPSQKCTL